MNATVHKDLFAETCRTFIYSDNRKVTLYPIIFYQIKKCFSINFKSMKLNDEHPDK